MSRTGLSAADLAKSLRTKAGDGSVEWCHEPMQVSVLLDIADMLDEHAKLRAARDTWQENDAKLRELVRDMWPHVRHRSRMCERCDLPCDESDECLLYEPMRIRMQELGIEVDE